ncbi:hypothetical protein [Ralstonia mojiangensis]|uniref:hypothetical protein n=1 Tax=Ralstonia mojiangensis TaxID=2953895 RepID=UPI002090EB95|nr:hypothetical protein [Ralstonia mojiangensis]MCO5410789.1 hypothetical protein [Ralstonia mojiangensis]
MPLSTGIVIGAAEHLAEKEVVKAAAKYLKDTVIAKWSEYRAHAFLSAFLEEFRKQQDVRHQSADLNDLLKLVSQSDKQTTALFDAYRRVALSSSKKIGPMVIGMQTAHIVLEDRDATADEELIFFAAETLNDRDFSDLKTWLEYVYVDDESPPDYHLASEFERRSVLVKGGPELPPGLSLDMAHLGLDDVPMDVGEDIGIFALKLKNIGLLTETVRRRENPREAGFTQYFVIVSSACQQLNSLAVRAMGALTA